MVWKAVFTDRLAPFWLQVSKDPAQNGLNDKWKLILSHNRKFRGRAAPGVDLFSSSTSKFQILSTFCSAILSMLSAYTKVNQQERDSVPCGCETKGTSPRNTLLFRGPLARLLPKSITDLRKGPLGLVRTSVLLHEPHKGNVCMAWWSKGWSC